MGFHPWFKIIGKRGHPGIARGLEYVLGDPMHEKDIFNAVSSRLLHDFLDATGLMPIVT